MVQITSLAPGTLDKADANEDGAISALVLYFGKDLAEDHVFY